MHLYSNNLTTIAAIFSLIMSELFPACFSRSNNFSLSQSSSSFGFFVRNIVEIPEAMMTGDLGNHIRDSFLLLFRPYRSISSFTSSSNS